MSFACAGNSSLSVSDVLLGHASGVCLHCQTDNQTYPLTQHWQQIKLLHAIIARNATCLYCVCAGNSGLSWSDVLLGDMPNVYVYAAKLIVRLETLPQHQQHVKLLHAIIARNATCLYFVCAGNSGLSWSDVLLGDMPNVYVYAANNPSESILAKRRGYGTIISHNVPPYARSVRPCTSPPDYNSRIDKVLMIVARLGAKDWCYPAGYSMTILQRLV